MVEYQRGTIVLQGGSEELLQRIEQCRQELIEAGENPDEYFKPIEPQMAAVYYKMV